MLRSQEEMNTYNANLELVIDRKNLFRDAYDQIMNKSPLDLKRRLHIRYKEEEGLDIGGLLR